MEGKDELKATQEQQTPPAIDEGTAANLKSIEDELSIEGEDENEQIVTAVATDEQRREQQLRAQARKENQAMMTAATAVVIAEKGLQLKWPFLKFTHDDKAELVMATKAVALKYGAGMPEWALPWQEEIELGGTAAKVGFNIFMAIQKHKAEQAEKAAEPPKKDDAGKPATPAGGLSLVKPETAAPAGTSLADISRMMDTPQE